MPKSFIGIDLGTTYSVVSYLDNLGRPQIIHNAEGQNITPSVVCFEENEVVLVGEEARRVLFESPNAFGRFKREMGLEATYTVNSKTFTPTQLSSFVLKKMKAIAEARVEIGQAVITIPANFSHEAREATMTAAKSAGLDVAFIINEPTAAALYYAFVNGHDYAGNYAVYDLGGGTFDVSIIRISGQDVEVLSTNGVAKLGGDDFDLKLQQLVQKKFTEKTGENLDPEEYTKNDAEEDKKSLSRRDSIQRRISRVPIVVTRDEFEDAISSLISQTEMLCEATIDEAGLEIDDIKGIFLVGGSTRIPAVKSSIQKIFEKEPEATLNVDEVVALGASLYAAYKGDRSHLNSMQVAALNKIKISESTSKCFGTLSLTRDEMNPQAHVLTNNVLIKKGDKIPCSVTQKFLTVHEGQTEVECIVTESTSIETDPRFVKTVWKGSIELPAGRPAEQEISVTYTYDANQIMKCEFKDIATGRTTVVDLDQTADKKNGDIDVDAFLIE